MPNIKLVVEYDGKKFYGWQSQPNLRTIESELERVLQIVLREKIHPLYSAGRTDSGVHARGQVLNFYTKETPDLFKLSQAVSNLLLGELAVVSAEVVPDNFHARHSSDYKQYVYTILNRRAPAVLDWGHAWFISKPLDIELMNREARSIIGMHDFTSFRGARCAAKSPVKEILESEISCSGDYVYYRVVGAGFLKQMVRAIVGTLVDLSKNRLERNSMLEIVAAKDRRAAGVTAPGYGLCLDWVHYPDSPRVGGGARLSFENP